jgi:hypothetical protein
MIPLPVTDVINVVEQARDLKPLLKARKLRVGGKKSEMVDRLVKYELRNQRDDSDHDDDEVEESD